MCDTIAFVYTCPKSITISKKKFFPEQREVCLLKLKVIKKYNKNFTLMRKFSMSERVLGRQGVSVVASTVGASKGASSAVASTVGVSKGASFTSELSALSRIASETLVFPAQLPILYGSVCLSKLKNTMTQKSLFDLKNHKC
jgi:hypothetical protein